MSWIDELVHTGLIAENQLPSIRARADEKYGGDLEKVLLDAGVDANRLLETKSQYYGIPVRSVTAKEVSQEALKYISEDSARQYGFAPIDIKDGVLEVGIFDPDNIAATDALQFIASKAGVPYKYFLITRDDFDTILKTYKGLGGEVDQAVSEFDKELAAVETPDNGTKKEQAQALSDEEKIVEEAPIIKIVAVIIRNAVEGDASDIHIENSGSNVIVRFRVDGSLHTSLVLPLNVYAGIIARIKILSKLRLDEKRKPQDGGFSTKIGERKIDLRVSTFPTYYGEKIVMRILDSERSVKTLDTLDMTPQHLAMVREALGRPYGLILITGPTGSGKSTTLYSMLNELDRDTENVVSLEDPVEYHIANVSQSQVMPEIGYTFAAGLRSILRQDPDIIMVGEIRDKETAQLAIQAALTGHLVLSTLHTNTALGAIPRLVDMGIDPYLIAPTLILTMAQRLTRTIHPSSRHQIPLDESSRKYIMDEITDMPAEQKAAFAIGDTMYEAVPSPECASGLKGRTAVFEMCKIDDDLQRIILKNPVEQELYASARAKGMLTMKEDAIMKSLHGMIPFKEIYDL